MFGSGPPGPAGIAAEHPSLTARTTHPTPPPSPPELDTTASRAAFRRRQCRPRRASSRALDVEGARFGQPNAHVVTFPCGPRVAGGREGTFAVLRTAWHRVTHQPFSRHPAQPCQVSRRRPLLAPRRAGGPCRIPMRCVGSGSQGHIHLLRRDGGAFSDLEGRQTMVNTQPPRGAAAPPHPHRTGRALTSGGNLWKSLPP